MIRPAPMVTQLVRGDATVLADFHRGRYFTLNPVSARIWALVRDGITLPALLAQLHDEYDVPAERVDTDAVAFLQALRAARLITCQPAATFSDFHPAHTYAPDSIERTGDAVGPTAADAPPRAGSMKANGAFRVPSVLRCGLLLLAVKLALRLLGFRRTCRWIRQRTTLIATRGVATPADVTATDYAIALAAALWPGRALCLEQSLMLYYVLRRAGIPAEFRMGVQPQPFVAHAWVEYHGAPVNDFPEHVAQLHPLEDVPL